MTLDDIRHTLLEAVKTGKVGTPVALRLHLQLTNADASLLSTAATLIGLCEPLFKVEPSQLFARSNAGGRQLSLLCETESGRTCSITIGSGSAKAASLNLLLVGNHGVIRLEGSELFDESSLNTSDANIDRWGLAIEQSLVSNALATV